MDYLVEAGRTAPREADFHGDMVSLHQFQAAIRSAIKVGNELDAMKKAFFYGKPNDILLFEANTPTFQTVVRALDDPAYDAQVQVIHAILGIFTEGTELLEALDRFLAGNELDATNVKEEIGDQFWYTAILCRLFGFSFEDAQVQNIAKLFARFPDKFSESAAQVRDLGAERQILEHFDEGATAKTAFERDLEMLINKHSLENGSDTPDFVLAEFLNGCLRVFNGGVIERERFYGRVARYSGGGDEPLPPAGSDPYHPLADVIGAGIDEIGKLPEGSRVIGKSQALGASYSGPTQTDNLVGPLPTQMNEVLGLVEAIPACATSKADRGWYCTRVKGHEGPCAAHHVGFCGAQIPGHTIEGKCNLTCGHVGDHAINLMYL